MVVSGMSRVVQKGVVFALKGVRPRGGSDEQEKPVMSEPDMVRCAAPAGGVQSLHRERGGLAGVVLEVTEVGLGSVEKGVGFSSGFRLVSWSWGVWRQC